MSVQQLPEECEQKETFSEAAVQEETKQPESSEAQQGAAQDELAQLLRRAEDAERALIYVQAEFQNFRRRTDEQMQADRKYAASELLKSLLPVLDNFERALRAAEQGSSMESIVAGIVSTQKLLQTSLERAGLTPIEAVGKEFNPSFHEAAGHADTEEYAPNTVAEELQRGYMLHERVLRPALVKVVAH